MARDWALFLHLSGVLLFVGGSIAVTALRLLAIGKQRPSESALLLRSVRPLVPVVGAGLLLTLGAGVWLADELRVAVRLRLASVGLRADRLARRRRRGSPAVETGARASWPSASPRKATGPPRSSHVASATRWR